MGAPYTLIAHIDFNPRPLVSSRHVISSMNSSISVPTLLLHVMNDPWIPVRPYLELPQPASPHVKIVVARSGGHVGFHEHGHTETWHDRRGEDFLARLERRDRG